MQSQNKLLLIGRTAALRNKITKAIAKLDFCILGASSLEEGCVMVAKNADINFLLAELPKGQDDTIIEFFDKLRNRPVFPLGIIAFCHKLSPQLKDYLMESGIPCLACASLHETLPFYLSWARHHMRMMQQHRKLIKQITKWHQALDASLEEDEFHLNNDHGFKNWQNLQFRSSLSFIRKVKEFDERMLANMGFNKQHKDMALSMMLELAFAQEGHKDITVTSLCHVCAMPLSTSLRCLEELEREGLIKRYEDAHDHRRKIVKLTDEGVRLMQFYLQKIKNLLDKRTQTML